MKDIASNQKYYNLNAMSQITDSDYQHLKCHA